MGKKHLTPAQIKMEMNALARESRMCADTSFTVSYVLMSWAMFKTFGFKQKRINDVLEDMKKYADKAFGDEDERKKLLNRANDITGTEYFARQYTPEEIKFRKGTYEYYRDVVQIPIQNAINGNYIIDLCTFVCALNDRGYGKERIMRAIDTIDEFMEQYKNDMSIMSVIRLKLEKEAGIIIQNPSDPLTKKEAFSVMCGG